MAKVVAYDVFVTIKGLDSKDVVLKAFFYLWRLIASFSVPIETGDELTYFTKKSLSKIQAAIGCSKLIIETLKQGVKYVQS